MFYEIICNEISNILNETPTNRINVSDPYGIKAARKAAADHMTTDQDESNRKGFITKTTPGSLGVRDETGQRRDFGTPKPQPPLRTEPETLHAGRGSGGTSTPSVSPASEPEQKQGAIRNALAAVRKAAEEHGGKALLGTGAIAAGAGGLALARRRKNK